MTGSLALVGGGEWTEGCTFDADLLASSGSDEVVVIPAGVAYENPRAAIDKARSWFGALGATVHDVPVFTRPDGFVEESVAKVASASFLYLPGTSPMHLRSVLKDSPILEAIVQAWQGGAVLAGSSAGADVLCDPMVDTRGGAFTVGMGVVRGLTVIPRFNRWSPELVHRTVTLAPAGLPVVGIPEATALLRSPEGAWSVAGVGECQVFVDGRSADLAALPG